MTTALVVGRANGVWDEIAAAKALVPGGKFDITLVTGPVVVDYPDEVDCWVWFHTELFEHYAKKRAEKGYSPIRTFWAPNYRGRPRGNPSCFDVRLINVEGGSSGYTAVRVALDKLHASHVVLAGCPMTSEGGKYDKDKSEKWEEAVAQRYAWERDKALIIGRVKSMSGWTQEFLGAPTREWFDQQVILAS